MEQKIELVRLLAAVALTMVAMIAIYVFTTWGLQIRERRRYKITFTKTKKR